MLGGADQKALFDYWHDRVRLTNLTRLGKLWATGVFAAAEPTNPPKSTFLS